MCACQAMLTLRVLAAQRLYMQIKVIAHQEKLLLELLTRPIVLRIQYGIVRDSITVIKKKKELDTMMRI